MRKKGKQPYSQVLAVVVLSLFAGDSQAQTCTTPPADMISWWDGDAISGATAQDIQGSNDGTLGNGIGTVAGQVGQAFSLDGIDDHVEIPDDASLEFGDGSADAPFTIDAWISRAVTGQSQTVVSKYNSFIIPRRQEYRFFVDENDQLRGAIFDVPGDFRKDVATIATIGTGWHHVAFTYDGSGDISGLRLYIDGDPETVISVSDHPSYVAMDDTIEPVRIGASITNVDGSLQEVFGGLIDEVEIFSRELSASEVQSVFSAGSAGKCKSPSSCRRAVISDTVSASATQTGTASCISGEAAVSGGFSLGSNALVVHAALPTSSLDAWEAIVENTDSSNAHGFDAIAVCCPATCTRMVVGDTISASATQTVTASCMGGETAVGGGFSLGSNALVIHASQPTSSLDAWEGVVENTDNTNAHSFDAVAVCCPATCSRVVVSDTVSASATQTGTASCMAGETAVGGGFSLGSNALVIHATQPTSSMDAWEGVVENTDNTNAHGFDVTAVCCAEPVPVEIQSFSIE